MSKRHAKDLEMQVEVLRQSLADVLEENFRLQRINRRMAARIARRWKK